MYSWHLPFELCELIIDNLDSWEDEDTLRACSLTCKAFLHASRYHLFYRVHLINRHIAQRFLDTICSTPSPTSPYQYIHYLCLSEERREPHLLWVNKALTLLATRLLDVTILELDHLQWNMLDDTGRAMILSGFQRVEHLVTAFSKFETSEQMNHLITSFPSLTHMSCSQTYWETGGILTVPLPHGLQSITLDSDQSIVFHQLLCLESHPRVCTVKFHYVLPDYVPNVGMLLKTLGPDLEELDLGDLRCALGFNQSNAEGQPYCRIAEILGDLVFLY